VSIQQHQFGVMLTLVGLKDTVGRTRDSDAVASTGATEPVRLDFSREVGSPSKVIAAVSNDYIPEPWPSIRLPIIRCRPAPEARPLSRGAPSAR